MKALEKSKGERSQLINAQCHFLMILLVRKKRQLKFIDRQKPHRRRCQIKFQVEGSVTIQRNNKMEESI